MRFLRHAPGGQKLRTAIEKQPGTGKALSMLAHTMGRAVDDRLSRGPVCSMEQVVAASGQRAGEPDVSREPVGTELATIAQTRGR